LSKDVSSDWDCFQQQEEENEESRESSSKFNVFSTLLIREEKS
jgi:hypothetical protein